jgi:hypothetical protein
MEVLLAALLDLQEEDAPARATKGLDGQLLRWGRRRGRSGVSARALRLAVLTWTRLHGIVGLELTGVFADMELDAGLLLDAEVDAAVQAGRGRA